MTMQTCRGCGAFLMPDWDTCKICGHDPAGPPPAAAAPEAKKGRKGRRADKPAKEPKAAKTAKAAKVEKSLEAAAPVYEPPAFEDTAFDDIGVSPGPVADPAAAPIPPAAADFAPPTVPAPAPAMEPARASASIRSAAPDLDPVTVRHAEDDDDDHAYEEFEPNRLPIILLVLMIVLLVGYFGIYLPTRDDGDQSPLDQVPGSQQLDESILSSTVSVSVALPEDEAHGITVEL